MSSRFACRPASRAHGSLDRVEQTLDLYGATPGQPSFANNCLLARRLAERGVRFIQLCHRDWDHHGGLPAGLRQKCKETDQGATALVTDFKQRGLLDDTLVVWGGEFGRTAYSQGEIKPDNFGRDHHPRCFTIWMAGGGVKGGYVHGETDEFGYNIVRDPVHVHFAVFRGVPIDAPAPVEHGCPLRCETSARSVRELTRDVW